MILFLFCFSLSSHRCLYNCRQQRRFTLYLFLLFFNIHFHVGFDAISNILTKIIILKFCNHQNGFCEIEINYRTNERMNKWSKIPKTKTTYLQNNYSFTDYDYLHVVWYCLGEITWLIFPLPCVVVVVVRIVTMICFDLCILKKKHLFLLRFFVDCSSSVFAFYCSLMDFRLEGTFHFFKNKTFHSSINILLLLLLLCRFIDLSSFCFYFYFILNVWISINFVQSIC